MSLSNYVVPAFSYYSPPVALAPFKGRIAIAPFKTCSSATGVFFTGSVLQFFRCAFVNFNIMKLQLITLVIALAAFSLVPACKKKDIPTPLELLGYAGKMAGKHLWRTTEYDVQRDSNGHIIWGSNGQAVTVPREVVISDSILVFSSTKIAFTTSRYSSLDRLYDTLNRTEYNEVEKTITFANSHGGFASGHYWTTKQELKYDYASDTFVRRIRYYGQNSFNDSFDVYYYSP